MKILNKVSISVLAVAFTLGLTGPIAAFAYTSPATVNLGTAGNFVILSKTGISTIGLTSVVGDIGVSPAQATYITGFGLTLPAASAFSTSALVTGKVYAPGYAVPTPSNISTAVSNMETAYTDAMGRAANVTELGAGNIGGLTLAPGVYKWGTGVTIPTNVTLSGSANDVWIFQIAQNLDISSAKNIVLAGGAQANNIFWVVAGQTTIGTTAVFNGNILDQTAIVLNTGAVLNGRALAQTAVTLQSNVVTMPISVVSTPAVSVTSSSGTNTSVTSVTSAVTAEPTNQSLQDQVSALLVTLHSLQAQVQARQQGSVSVSTTGQSNTGSTLPYVTYQYVNTTGNVQTVTATSADQAFRSAINIAPTSGVIRVNINQAGI